MRFVLRNSLQVVFILQILCILPGHLIHVRAHVCEVGRETDESDKWCWVLPYLHPCDCTKVVMGGLNTRTPIRPFKPVYVDRPLLSDNVSKIREYYGLVCVDKDTKPPVFEFCPANQTRQTDPAASTALVVWSDPKANDNSGNQTTVTCNPESGSLFEIGVKNVLCEARDESGNLATCNFTVDVIDAEPPVFKFCPHNYSMQTEPAESTAVVVWHDLKANDNSGYQTVTCNPESGSSFEIGAKNVLCKARDAGGNSATCNFTVDVIDVEPPVFKFCPLNRSMATNSKESTALVVWRHPEANDNSGYQTIVTCNLESGSLFEIGANIVLCEARDASGNNATCNFTVDVIDNEPPVLDFCPTNLKTQTDPVGPTALVVWRDPEPTDNSGNQTTVTCYPKSGALFEIGATNVLCEARDVSGNSATCNFTVDVIDFEAPIFIVCSNYQKMETYPSEYTATGVWKDPEATDNSGHHPTVTCNPESGSQFNVGSTNVVCKARDASGNSATCNFTVDVIASEAPKFIVCPDAQNTEISSTESTAVVTWNDPEATDNSGQNPIVVCNVKSGSQFEIGRTEVSCEAKDAVGNRATCNFTIDIIDIEPPTFVLCPANQKVETKPAESTAVVDWSKPEAADNSGQNPNVTCNVESGTQFIIGLTKVTCEAQDASGNIAKCNFTIYTKDVEAPTFHFCPANQIIAEFTISMDMVVSNATDNSGQKPTLTCVMVSDYLAETGQIGNITCEAFDESGNGATCTFTVDAAVCIEYLGMKNGDIPDGNIQASSERYLDAYNARLDRNSHWATDGNRPWIQADIGYQTYVSGIVTQGEGKASGTSIDWVTTLSVSTFASSTSDPEMLIKENGELKIFTANTDAGTKVENYFPKPLFARIVRITCETKHGSFWNLRFELLGCKMPDNK